MKKRNKIIFWIATSWLCLGMLSTGIVQMLKTKEEVDLFTHLGYPVYFLTLLAICKFLGVIVVLLPKAALLKEWAYAGFFFAMAGAFVSHMELGDSLSETLPPLLLLVLTVLSWYFRPTDRKLVLLHQ
jgi:hypothetical protein